MKSTRLTRASSDVQAKLVDAVKETASSLQTSCERAEGIILESAREAVAVAIQQFAADNRCSFRDDAHPGYFQYDGLRFSLRLAPDTVKADLLRVIIGSADQTKIPIDRKSEIVGVQGAGRFTKVSAKTARVFTALKPTIVSSAQNVLESGYRWLREYVNAALDELQRDSAARLYAEIRRKFSDGLSSQIWLFIVLDGKAFYLLDPVARQAALRNATKRTIPVELSALEKLAVFATTQLSFGSELYSRKALETNATMDVPFGLPTYDTRFQIAEQEIYQAPGFTVQPLIREGQTLMVAGYPQHLRSEIEVPLSKLKEPLRKILNERASHLREIARHLRKATHSPEIRSIGMELLANLAKVFASP